MANIIHDSAARKWLILEEARELVRFREFLRLLVVNSIATRYKRSVLGILWTLLNPLATMAVLTFVFSTLFHNDLAHYPVYLLAGLIFWQFFSQTTVQAMHTLVWGAGLLKRTYIPRSAFAVAAVGNGLFNLAVSLLPLILMMLFTGQPLYAAWWFFPIAVVLLTIFTLGMGLFLSALAVQFTDIVDMYQLVVQILFWATPIMYPKSIMPAQYALLLNFNPLYHLLELFRTPIYHGWLPGPNTIVAAAGISILTLLAGWGFFTARADQIVYRI